MSYEKLKSGSRDRKLAVRAASKNLVSPKQGKPGKTVVARQYARDLTFRLDPSDVEEGVPSNPSDVSWWMFPSRGDE